MANITISNLSFDGSDLFMDSEGFMNDLSEDELVITWGATGPSSPFCVAGLLALAGAIIGYRAGRNVPQ